MTTRELDCATAKSGSRQIFEFFLLMLCVCVIALRATYAEMPIATPAHPTFNPRMGFYSLFISGVLIFASAGWLIWAMSCRTFRYRFCGIEAGLCLFALAGGISIAAASNVRAAVTDFATMLAPVLMAILLVQILSFLVLTFHK